MSSPKVTIIILHLDDRDALRACLKSCDSIAYPNHDILVVENGSRDALNLDQLKVLSGHVTEIIKSAVNLGYARGNNLGIKQALARGADYVLLLNDDTEVAPEFLDVLVRASERHADVGALCPMIYYFAHRQQIWFAGGEFNADSCEVLAPGSGGIDGKYQHDQIDSDWLTGCCLLLRRRVLEKLGLLDERFFIYWGDTDFSLRIKKAGFQNIVVPRARIWHKVSLSTGGDDSPLKAYHKVRGHFLFMRLHAPHAFVKLHLAVARDIGWLLLKAKDKHRLTKARALVAAIKDYHLGRTGKGPEWLWQSR